MDVKKKLRLLRDCRDTARILLRVMDDSGPGDFFSVDRSISASERLQKIEREIRELESAVSLNG